jgi:hypothetical protein
VTTDEGGAQEDDPGKTMGGDGGPSLMVSTCPSAVRKAGQTEHVRTDSG